MDKAKTILDLLDLLLKVGLAIAAVAIFGMQEKRLELEQKTQDLASSRQTSNVLVAEKIIELLFDEKSKCIAEDQAFLIDFLIDNNNHYNAIKIDKDDFYQASAARRNCVTGPVAADATAATKVYGDLKTLTPSNVEAVSRELSSAVRVQVQGVGDEKPQGYVAVGTFDSEAKTFRNFDVPSASIQGDGVVKAGTVIKAKWSVYLRADTSNTQSGNNSILGLVPGGGCAEVIESMPGIRSQTWAAVKLTTCPS